MYGFPPILGKEQYESLAKNPGMPEGGKGHLLYEKHRTATDPVAQDRIGAESRAYYDAVRKAAGS